MFVTCWTFRTTPALLDRFLAAYAPGGDWTRLMRGAPGYLGTELCRDTEDPMRFLVLDRWSDEAAFRAFRRDHQAEYRALDNRCMDLTEKEEKVGLFVGWTQAG